MMTSSPVGKDGPSRFDSITITAGLFSWLMFLCYMLVDSRLYVSPESGVLPYLVAMLTVTPLACMFAVLTWPLTFGFVLCFWGICCKIFNRI